MCEPVEIASRNCPVELAMEVVGGKWKLIVLELLDAGVMRFGQLQHEIPTITPRMLTRRLRELDADGLVARTVHAESPPPGRIRSRRTRAELEPRGGAAEGLG